MSFTMLVLLHMKDAKLSNYSVMFNFQTRLNQIHVIWIKQLHPSFATLFAVVVKKLLSPYKLNASF